MSSLNDGTIICLNHKKGSGIGILMKDLLKNIQKKEKDKNKKDVNKNINE